MKWLLIILATGFIVWALVALIEAVAYWWLILKGEDRDR